MVRGYASVLFYRPVSVAEQLVTWMHRSYPMGLESFDLSSLGCRAIYIDPKVFVYHAKPQHANNAHHARTVSRRVHLYVS